MSNLKKATILSFILAGGHFTFPTMMLLLIVWCAIHLYIVRKNLHTHLSRNEEKLYQTNLYVYPLAEMGIKYLIIRNLIPYSWNYLNRAEHFLSAMAIGILIYPILKATISKLNKTEAFLFFVFSVIFIGNLNEFFEYTIRVILHMNEHFAIYYWDTIYDMILNVLGSVSGFLLLQHFSSNEEIQHHNSSSK